MMDVFRLRFPRAHVLGLAVLAAATLLLVSATAHAADGAIDEELGQFWSTDRELPAVQDKLYTREGRISVGIFSGLMSSQPFLYYFPVGGRVSYHFTDHLGLEVAGQFMDAGVLTHDTELTDFLKSRRGEGFNASAHTEDRFLWRSNALMVWSPLYGKLSFLQRKLAHFDLNLVAGLGVVGVERPGEARADFKTTLAPEAVVGGGVQFYLTPSVLLRLDGRAYVYQGVASEADSNGVSKVVKSITVPAEFLFGVNFMF